MIATYGALDLTAYPYSLLFGTDVGQPENVTEALAFFLQDGEVELSDRASNRTLAFTVLVEGADLAECADNEAALVAETEKARNTFSIDPEDGGPVTVYETFRAQVRHARDDDGELSRLRLYTVTVKALPFARSEDEVTTAALSSGTTTTTLDACTAATGWSGFINSVSTTPTATGGAVRVTNVSALPNGNNTWSLQKTFAATTTSTKYLVVDWKPPANHVNNRLAATGDGTALPLLFTGSSPTAGYTRSMFYVAASSLAVTRLDLTGYQTSAVSGVFFSVDNVSVSDVAPTYGTARQQARSVAVSGSARTQGSLAVESATAALGDDVLVYVYPSSEDAAGYTPSLRQFRAAGNTETTNSAMVSGKTEPTTPASIHFQVPVALLPRGNYVLMGRISAASAGASTLSFVVSTRVASGTADHGLTIKNTTLSLTTSMATYVIGQFTLPTADVPEMAQSAFVNIQVSGATNTPTYDEFWLFNTSIGQLTWVNCGTGAGAVGSAARRLWLEPATATTPRPTVRMGHTSDRSDSYFPEGSLKSWQPPQFPAEQVNTFVVTPNATDAAVSLRHYPRWHTNAGS